MNSFLKLPFLGRPRVFEEPLYLRLGLEDPIVMWFSMMRITSYGFGVSLEIIVHSKNHFRWKTLTHL